MGDALRKHRGNLFCFKIIARSSTVRYNVMQTLAALVAILKDLLVATPPVVLAGWDFARDMSSECALLARHHRLD